MVKFILTRQYATVFDRNGAHTILSENANFVDVVKILKTNPDDDVLDELLDLIDPKVAVLKTSNEFKVQDGVLYYKDMEIRNSLVDRITNMSNRGESVVHLEVFLKNLMENPSESSIMELYEFLEANALPITEDGYFLAYKKVRSNFYDIHSGTFDNSPGKVVEIPRDKVDDDRNRTCSFGLHACSFEYLKNFGKNDSKVVIVKINPRDVVSVPIDYENTKMRVCRYTVLAEIPSTQKIRDYAVDTTKGNLTENWDEYSDDEEKIDDLFDDQWDDNPSTKSNSNKETLTSADSLWDYILAAQPHVKWKNKIGYQISEVPAGENWLDYLGDFEEEYANGLFRDWSVPKINNADYDRVIVVHDNNSYNVKPKLFVFAKDRLL